jgi:hypothetical protein
VFFFVFGGAKPLALFGRFDWIAFLLASAALALGIFLVSACVSSPHAPASTDSPQPVSVTCVFGSREQTIPLAEGQLPEHPCHGADNYFVNFQPAIVRGPPPTSLAGTTKGGAH